MSAKNLVSQHSLNSDTNQYLDLWKWFTDDAAKIKDKMWTMASFFYSLLGALLGFMAKHLSVAENGKVGFQVEQPPLVIITSAIGLILSAYVMFMLREYGLHIRSGWNRADYIRFQIEGLSDIWCYDDPYRIEADKKLKKEASNKLPRVAQRLIQIMFFYFFLFLLTLLLALLQ